MDQKHLIILILLCWNLRDQKNKSKGVEVKKVKTAAIFEAIKAVNLQKMDKWRPQKQSRFMLMSSFPRFRVERG